MERVGKSNMEALVSIIVPVYNCDKYLEKCLTSIMKQSYSQLEILVVNDGSTDNSQKIIEKCKHRDQRIQDIYQNNDGVASARNRALKCATGKYYLFIDGDDYIGTNYVKNLTECAERNQSDLVICGYTLAYPNKNKNIKVLPGVYQKNKKEEWAYRISSTCSRLYRSSFWNANGLMFVKEEGARAEDVPLALFSNVMAKNICFVNEADYFYVQHKGSAMNSISKVPFLFPYKAFEGVYLKIKNAETENSKSFFFIGVLKVLAQFEYVLYRNADKKEKDRFHAYIMHLLKDDFDKIQAEWDCFKRNIDFPLTHKIAISFFCRKIKKYY